MAVRSKLGAGVAILGLLISGTFATPASAQGHRDDHRDDRRGGERHDHDRDRDHGWGGGYYAEPPVVYGPPAYYPPPVVYGPGVGIVLPGIGITIQ